MEKNIWELLSPKQKIKLVALIITLIAGTWGITTFCFLFPPMYRESEQVWNEHLQRQLNKKEIKSVGDSSIKAESYAVSEDREEPTTASLLPSEEIKEILPKIQILESSGGKNDSCKNKNLGVNGYGFRQNTFEWKCYKTKEEVEKEVAAWFEKNLRDKTLAESLCYYNRGIVTEDCEYAKKFASL